MNTKINFQIDKGVTAHVNALVGNLMASMAEDAIKGGATLSASLSPKWDSTAVIAEELRSMSVKLEAMRPETPAEFMKRKFGSSRITCSTHVQNKSNLLQFVKQHTLFCHPDFIRKCESEGFRFKLMDIISESSADYELVHPSPFNDRISPVRLPPFIEMKQLLPQED